MLNDTKRAAEPLFEYDGPVPRHGETVQLPDSRRYIVVEIIYVAVPGSDCEVHLNVRPILDYYNR